MKILKNILQKLILLFIFLLPWQARFIYDKNFLGGVFWEYGSFSLYFTEVLLGFILILAIIYFLPKLSVIRNIRKKLLLSNHVFVISVILVVFVFNLIFSLDKQIFLYKLTWLIEGLALMFLIIGLRVKWTKIAWAFVLSGFVQSVLAISQFVEQKVVGNSWLGIASQNPEVLGTPVIALEKLRWLRSFGSLPHPNILGGFLVIVLIVLIFLYAHDHKSKWGKVLPAFFVINAFGLLTSFSRSAWLSFIFSLVFLFIFLKISSHFTSHSTGLKKEGERDLKEEDLKYSLKKLTVVFVLIVFLFSLSYPQLVKTRLFGGQELEQKSNIERITGYEQAWQIFKQSPKTVLFGVGLGNYSLALSQLEPNQPAYVYQPVHNIFVLMVVELGVCFLVFLISCFLVFLKKLKLKKEFSVLILSLFTLGLFDHYLWSFYFGLILLAVALSFVYDCEKPVDSLKLK